MRIKSLLGYVCASAVMALYLSGSIGHADGTDPDADYDRLDGTGSSGKKVNVIEWEGNLEIHVYPAGSLKGLALKLDKTNKDKPVMVIGYRFVEHPDVQLVRRAILGIDMSDGFRAYKDPTADGYDKIIISNNGLSSPLAVYRLEPGPKQNYPDAATAKAAAQMRLPASSGDSSGATTQAPARNAAQDAADQQEMEDSGSIRPFMSGSRH